MALLDRDYMRLTPAEERARREHFARRAQTTTPATPQEPIPVRIVTTWTQLIGQLVVTLMLTGLLVLVGHIAGWW